MEVNFDFDLEPHKLISTEFQILRTGDIYINGTSSQDTFVDEQNLIALWNSKDIPLKQKSSTKLKWGSN